MERHLRSISSNSLATVANWEDMQTFLQVARSGSFAGASHATSRHHNTIKRSIDRLSHALGVQLYVAKSNGIELTQQGNFFANRLASVDGILLDALRSTSDESMGIEGSVRVCLTGGLAAFWAVPNLYDKLGARRSIQLDFRHFPAGLSNFYQNNSDIVVSLTPMQGADIHCIRAGYLHLVPVAAKGYINQRGQPTLENLGQHDFVQCSFYDAHSSVWKPWHSLLAKARLVDHADDFVVYGMQVKANAGIGLLGSYVMMDPDAVLLNLGISLRVGIYAVSLDVV